VQWLVVGQGLSVALIGIGIGLVAAFVAARGLASIVYGVTARDPGTFAAVAIVLITVAGVACLLPARRAAKVDPMVALRYD
jgi:putative ABC transport system permease protein